MRVPMLDEDGRIQQQNFDWNNFRDFCETAVRVMIGIDHYVGLPAVENPVPYTDGKWRVTKSSPERAAVDFESEDHRMVKLRPYDPSKGLIVIAGLGSFMTTAKMTALVREEGKNLLKWYRHDISFNTLAVLSLKEFLSLPQTTPIRDVGVALYHWLELEGKPDVPPYSKYIEPFGIDPDPVASTLELANSSVIISRTKSQQITILAELRERPDDAITIKESLEIFIQASPDNAKVSGRFLDLWDFAVKNISQEHATDEEALEKRQETAEALMHKIYKSGSSSQESPSIESPPGDHEDSDLLADDEVVKLVETDEARAVDAAKALMTVPLPHRNVLKKLNIRLLAKIAPTDPWAVIVLNELHLKYRHRKAGKILRKLEVPHLETMADNGDAVAFDALFIVTEESNRKAFNAIARLASKHPQAVQLLEKLRYVSRYPWYSTPHLVLVISRMMVKGNPRRVMRRLDVSVLAEKAKTDKKAYDALTLLDKAGNPEARKARGALPVLEDDEQ